MFESESVSHSVMSDSWRFHVAMKFSRQEYWGGLPFPSLGDLPDPGIKPTPLARQADSLQLNHLGSPSGIFIQRYRTETELEK